MINIYFSHVQRALINKQYNIMETETTKNETHIYYIDFDLETKVHYINIGKRNKFPFQVTSLLSKIFDINFSHKLLQAHYLFEFNINRPANGNSLLYSTQKAFQFD